MKRLLVADLFCGAGGTSTGAERAVRAIGRKMTLVCVNHWPVAIETHKKNHPSARHYVEDVAVADPVKLVPEGYLDLLMASPECRFYSRARGGKPVHDQSRMNPWAVLRWLTSLNVRCLLVENVPEFIDWGPLLADGTPDPRHKGEFFQSWFFAIQKAGYQTEWHYLNAADFGDATTRTRFFLIARKDGKSVRWPSATHSPTGGVDMVEHLHKWRAAREIIDWSNPGRSLLDDPHYQRRPLSEKTRRRIAKGLLRFGGQLAPLYIQLLGIDDDVHDSVDDSVQPFVMGKQGSPAIRSTDQPVPTVTTMGAPLLVNPTLVKYFGTAFASSVDKPVPTLTTKSRYGLVNPKIEPFVLGQHSGSAPRSGEKPIPTIMSDGAIALITPFIVQNRIRPDGDRVYDIRKPINTVTGHGAGALVNPILVDVNHSGGDGRSRDVDDPLGTVTTRRGTSLVEPVIVQTDQTGRNGSYVRPVTAPLSTIVTKQNIALVEPVIEAVKARRVDPRRLILIDDEPYLLDLRFRMLSNLELARAMGFSDEESNYEFVGNISEVTRQIGNAVPVNMAKALVLAILS